MCNHHYKLFPILFIVFNDDFTIEIMIVLYCVYINTTSKHCNISLHFIFLYSIVLCIYTHGNLEYTCGCGFD